MAFRMGISPSVPIKNNSFREGTYKTTTVAVAYTELTSLTVATTTPAINQLLRAGDVIQIGPSTYTGSVGRSEYVSVASVGSTTVITLDSALTYDYSIGDAVSFIGTRLAGGWTLSSNLIADILPNYMTYFDSLGTKFRGFSDNFAQSITYYANGADIRQTLGDVLIPGIVYRLGGFTADLDWATGAGATEILRLQFSDGVDQTNYTISTGADGDRSAWTEFSTTHTVNANPTTATYMLDYAETADKSLTVVFDDVYLEHARDTDDYASGVYTFDDDPDAGSVNFNLITQYQTLELANGGRVRYDATGTGRGIAKYETTAEFTNAPKALYNNLVNMLAWQNSGNLLVFHPGGDYTLNTSPYIQRTGQRIPPVMYGYMELTPKTHNHWDLLNYVSFSFKFMEV